MHGGFDKIFFVVDLFHFCKKVCSQFLNNFEFPLKKASA